MTDQIVPYTPPIPQELRHLPIDSPQVVFREPQRFGTITKTREGFPTHIRLNRVPTALTASEKAYIFHCEKVGKTRGARYQDIRQPEMYRCPLPDCQYSVINLRTLPTSIGVHFREYHPNPPETYCIHYTHRGRPDMFRHPEPPSKDHTDHKTDEQTTSSKSATANDPGTEDPQPKRLRGRETRYTQPSILDAMLRIRRQGATTTPEETRANEERMDNEPAHKRQHQLGTHDLNSPP